MTEYYICSGGFRHPFPFVTYARAMAHGYKLGGCFEVRGYKVQIVSEDEREESELDSVVEHGVNTVGYKYAEKWGE